MNVKILSVGKPKTSFWREAAEHYVKRLSMHYRLQETTVKDGPGKLPAAERNKVEGRGILAALQDTDVPIRLDERGKSYTSKQLAELLGDLTMDANRTCCFIIGGPFGFSEEVVKRCPRSLSLSPMTLPHEAARVILLEQLYRAHAILHNLPYHHE